MSKSIYKKIVSILFGIVFLLGGADVASADWSFTYTKDGSSITDSSSPNEAECITKKNVAVSVGGQITAFCAGTDAVVAGVGTGETTQTTPQHPQGWAYQTFVGGVGIWSSGYPTAEDCSAAVVAAGATNNCTQSIQPTGTGFGTSGNVAGTDVYSGPTELKNFDCGISIKSMDMDIMGCFPIGVYYLIYKPVSVVFIGTSYLFDIILDLSIKKEFVDRPFINSSWTVVRDFSNMIFIFILLYTGIMTMIGGRDWKRTVLYVILIALLINFSLFFTKVIIDAGNILAVGVSDAIKSGHPSISAGLVEKFKPQAFLGKTGELKDAMDAIIIFIIAAIINGYAAYIFFKAALLFFGRLIAFWFLMIISPFAFISLTFPKGNKFQECLDMILNQAFVAPVYLFLIYLILQVINVQGGILGNTNLGVVSGSFFFDKLITPIIMATLILFAMQQALKFAESMAGEFGKMGSKMSGSVLGLAGGATIAGVSLAGRGLAGGGAAYALKKGWVSSESRVGGVAKTLTQSSFDVRNLAGEKSILGKTIGKNISKVGGAFGVNVGKGGGIGGVEMAEKERIKEELKKVESGKVSVFEENTIRAQAEAQQKANQENVIKTADELEKATGALVGIEKEFEEASKAHDASGVDKAEKDAEAFYVEALKRVENAKGTPDEDKAQRALNYRKDELDTAKTNRSNSPTAIALKEKTAILKTAKESIKTAETAKIAAEKEAKKSIEEIGKAAVDAINKGRAEIHAKKAEAGGRHTTAAKIRSGEKSSEKSVEDMIKEAAKKEAEKASKKE